MSEDKVHIENEFLREPLSSEDIAERLHPHAGEGLLHYMQRVCDSLCNLLEGYDWAGFYMIHADEPGILVLGPFCGEKTEHVRIPVGRGICGMAAEKKDTIIVDNVSSEKNYLSCSIHVKSEIVVPLFDRNGNVAGELDVDSHRSSRFNDSDRLMLEEVAFYVSELM